MGNLYEKLRGSGLLDARRRRLLAAAITLGVLIGIVLGNAKVWPSVVDEIGEDYQFFVNAAQHWLDTGSFYLARQLAGPYVAVTAVDVLYPPPALILFLPFVWLPAPLWWFIPMGIVVAVVVWSRPRYWFWPILAVLAWIPRDESIVIWGNTAMWVAALVALSVRFGWPSALIVFKPSFLPFIFLRSNRRTWFVAAAVIAVLQIPLLPLWIDYITAMRNNVGSWPGLLYSVPDYVFVSVPLLAWLAGTRRQSSEVQAVPLVMATEAGTGIELRH